MDVNLKIEDNLFKAEKYGCAIVIIVYAFHFK